MPVDRVTRKVAKRCNNRGREGSQCEPHGLCADPSMVGTLSGGQGRPERNSYPSEGGRRGAAGGNQPGNDFLSGFSDCPAERALSDVQTTRSATITTRERLHFCRYSGWDQSARLRDQPRGRSCGIHTDIAASKIQGFVLNKWDAVTRIDVPGAVNTRVRGNNPR